MHEALLLVATAISRAHDRWLLGLSRRFSLRAQIAFLEGQVARLQAENALLRNRFLRVPARRRPHYRKHERLEILWHAARYGLSLDRIAGAFVLTRQTILNWRRVARRKDPRLLPPLRGLSDLVHELVHRLKAEWPHWGTRRIAAQLARLGVKVARTSVQRILQRGTPQPGKAELISDAPARTLLARHPGHVWLIDFTKIRGGPCPLWVGAVMDAFSRRILSVGVIPRGPSALFTVTLLRRAVRDHGAPRWLVSDRDPTLRARSVNAFLTRVGPRRRYGAIGRKGSIALIERLWRSMKAEYVRRLFFLVPVSTLERQIRRWVRWYNAERPHQGLGQRTPDEVYRDRPPKETRNLTAGTLAVRFLEGDPRLPILRLRRAG